MKLLFMRFVSGAVVGYAAFVIVGALSAPSAELEPIDRKAAAEALAFSFPGVAVEPGQWVEASGASSHGWLFRRAFVVGQVQAEAESNFAEQVLKVGWPFTVVRGFVRSVGTETVTDGARVLGAVSNTAPVRMIPLQPVWPGVVVLGLLGILVLSIFSRFRRRAPAIAGRWSNAAA